MNMRVLRTVCVAVFFLVQSFSLSAECNHISNYTEQKIYDFLNMRIVLRNESMETAAKMIRNIREDSFSKLEENAIDLEQESCILDGLYNNELFERCGSVEATRKEMRDMMKSLMLKSFDVIENRGEEKTCKWLYCIAGDVTSYYMTRSVSATFYYGLKVKSMYEHAIKKDLNLTCANVSLGNWYFFAPGIFGGSKKKAQKCYENAIKGARNDGEMFTAYEFMSQIYYEMKNTDSSLEYIKKARNLNICEFEIQFIEKINKNGYSIYQYMRNKSGIDQEIPESEKDDADKKDYKLKK